MYLCKAEINKIVRKQIQKLKKINKKTILGIKDRMRSTLIRAQTMKTYRRFSKTELGKVRWKI